VELLLKAGANTNAKNKLTGATALHTIVQSYKVELDDSRMLQIVELLVKHENNNTTITTTIKDFYNRTPFDILLERIEAGDEKKVEEKLKELLKPPIPPIFKAIQDNQLEIVKSILQENIKVLRKEYLHKTPLTTATDQLFNFLEEEELFEDEEDEEKIKTTVQILDLLFSTYNNNTEVLSLNKKKEDRLVCEEHIDDEESTLHKCCLLLKTRLQKNKDDDTILYHLKRVTKLLYDSSFTTKEEKEEIYYLLNDSARRGNIQLLQYMMDTLQIDPNTQARQGLTALHMAARCGKMTIIQYLLTLEVDVDVTCNQSKTAMDYAKANQRDEILKLLLDAEKQQKEQSEIVD